MSTEKSTPEVEVAKISAEDLQKAYHLPVRTHVRVSGLNKIHPQVIMKDLETIKRCRSIAEIANAMDFTRNRWLKLGVFGNVDYNLEPTSDGSANDVCVKIDVQEAKPKKSIGFYTTETSLPEIVMSMNGAFGGRYSIRGNYFPPTARLHSLTLSVVSNVPKIGQQAEYSISKQTEDKAYQLAAAEKVEEIKGTMTYQKTWLTSIVTYGCQRRLLIAKNRSSLPEDALPDFELNNKGYFRHQLTLSSAAYHSDPYLYGIYPLPICGADLLSNSEIAGGLLGGKYSFFKTEVQATKYWPLGNFLSFQWSVKLGGIFPFGGSRIPYNDRLFLSNCHVRGFRSIGPANVDNGSTERFAATGGNGLWVTSLNVNFPFLFFPENGLASMHLFANAGNLRMVDSLVQLKDWYSWVRNCACSIGGGIVVTRIPLFGVIPSGRFEINLSVPVGINKRGDIVFRNGRQNLFDRVRFGLVWSSNASF